MKSDIHIVMPFYRTHLKDKILGVYEGKCVHLHPIMTAEEWTEWPDWVEPVLSPPYDGTNYVGQKINNFIATQDIDLNAYYWQMNDDDSVEDGVIESLRNMTDPIVFISMKRGYVTPRKGVPIENQHPTSTLYAKPENVKVCGIGCEQMVIRGDVFKNIQYGTEGHFIDGEMAVWLQRKFPIRYEPDLFVLFNYFEPWRWKGISLTNESLNISKDIANTVHTFHTDHRILYDIANQFFKARVKYLEIGCFAGASSCLMLQRKFTKVCAIDMGEIVRPEIVYQNIKNHIKHDNEFCFIQGNSHEKETVDILMNICPEYDILFIDGDHSHNSVIKDFLIYSQYVRPYGFVVFDDYGDESYPGVREAVDKLILIDGWDIYGQFGNEFVMRKHG